MSNSDVFGTLARAVCERFGVRKVYFARALGHRLHYLGGHGEETYLPPEKVEIDEGLWMFYAGAEELPPGQKEELLRAVREAALRLRQHAKEEGTGNE
ncbi:hypothetical protein ACP3TJ_10020 [Desulforudis sp. 1088]|uniref:hypothetical protein n=1 Tax=unclassified Candidatus Desulforudis TaxID=2635950 RepID=UPI003CE44E26